MLVELLFLLCMYYLVLKVDYLLFDTNDEIRDLTRVATEPELQPVSQEDFSLSTGWCQAGNCYGWILGGG